MHKPNCRIQPFALIVQGCQLRKWQARLDCRLAVIPPNDPGQCVLRRAHVFGGVGLGAVSIVAVLLMDLALGVYVNPLPEFMAL